MKYGELVKLLKQAGYIIIRKSGSHVIWGKPEGKGRIVIPYHQGKEVKKGLLKAILKVSGIKTNKR